MIESLLVFCALSQGLPAAGAPQKLAPRTEPIGQLEYFLRNTKGALVQEKSLGGFATLDRVTFSAVVARDPRTPGIEVKGLKVMFTALDKKKRERSETLYLDNAGLIDFEKSLRELPFEPSRYALVGGRRKPKAYAMTPVAPAYDVSADPAYHALQVPVFSLTWIPRKHDSELVFRSFRTYNTYSFPRKTLNTVEDILSDGRNFLAEHEE